MIAYLHGLNSSPLSSKAILLAEYCAQRGLNCAVPQLHHRPQQAAAQIRALLENIENPLLVGSSMGGYYATWYCENHPTARAVLINPAVTLADKLADLVGQKQQLYHSDESYVFSQEHLAEFRALNIDKISCPQQYTLLAQTGDEVLDYQEAVAFYDGATQIVEKGGDHSFVDFQRHLPLIANLAADES